MGFIEIHIKDILDRAENDPDNFFEPSKEYLALPENFRKQNEARGTTLNHLCNCNTVIRYTKKSETKELFMSKARDLIQMFICESLMDVMAEFRKYIEQDDVNTDLVNDTVARIVAWVEAVQNTPPGHVGSLLRLSGTSFDMHRINKELKDAPPDVDTKKFLSELDGLKWKRAVIGIFQQQLKNIRQEQNRKKVR